MQLKTIKKIISSKMEEWLESIIDTKLRSKVKNNLIVTGGCITSLLLNEKVNDYDIYIQNRDVLHDVIKYYGLPHGATILDGKLKDKYLSEIKDNFAADDVNAYKIAVLNLKDDQLKMFFDTEPDITISNTEDRAKYSVAYLSPNAISLTDDIQIVTRFWGVPDVVHESYDFVHATNYFTFKEGLVTNKLALESILTKSLTYTGSLYPVTSIIRFKKFVGRGWTINAGEILKIIFQCSQLDLTDISVLEEQLIGVDVAYFRTLIDAIRTKNDTKIDNLYLMKLIDKIFN